MSVWAIVVGALALVVLLLARRMPEGVARWVLPTATGLVAVSLWQLWCDWKSYDLTGSDGKVRHIQVFPGPLDTLAGMAKLASDGQMLRHSVASLYRVAAGFGLACVVGVPLGLWAGWSTRAMRALNPLVQALRPISPIAWIPVAILWFGIKDASAIFLIFVASIFPVVTGTMTAVRAIPQVYVRSAQNFGVRGFELFRRVVFPAALPQILTSLRIALGIAWMVIVAAEMIAVDQGLGYQIMDARNANNYDLVTASMVFIGLIGIALDYGLRRFERLDEVRWGYSKQ